MTEIRETYMAKVERTRLLKTVCDRCGGEVEALGYHETREFELGYTSGKNHGTDGGYKEGWAVSDLCDECVCVLYDLLITNGFKITDVGTDW
jgi:hypothetical protein